MSAELPISRRPDLAAAIAMLEAANLPTSDLIERHREHFFFVGPFDAPTGLIGLELKADIALLRSLVVSPTSRGGGTGSTLVAHAEDYARSRDVRHLYLLTTTAAEFFRKRGYVQVARDEAPAAIRQTREFAGICPASAALMTKQL